MCCKLMILDVVLGNDNKNIGALNAVYSLSYSCRGIFLAINRLLRNLDLIIFTHDSNLTRIRQVLEGHLIQSSLDMDF